MPSLKEIRSRVASVKNTQKITRAMKLVAAAKLRRAQDAVVAARPYSLKMREVITSLVQEVDAESNPLFQKREVVRNVLLVPMSSDRGLCGAFNSSIFRRIERFLRENGATFEKIAVAPIGRKGRGYFRRRGTSALVDLERVTPLATTANAVEIANILTRAWLDGEVDEVYLVFNEFRSALTQVVTVEPLLPLTREVFLGPEALALATAAQATSSTLERIYEPGKAEVLGALLPRFIESQVLRGLLESQASEQGARMTAMDSASNNAKDLIGRLTLNMNRARQAMITTELMEITSGAEALKG